MSTHMFSESWHQVCALQLGLLPTVNIHKQIFRGEEWYVLRDAFNSRFYKIRPDAYRFIVLLDAKKTVEEAWDESLLLHPDSAPGQEEVIRLLSQLHSSNLLYFRNRPNSSHIFERFAKNKRKEIRTKILSFLFIRIPLWDPDAWLNQVLPIIRAVFAKTGLFIWLLVLLLGVQAVLENFAAASDQAQGMLSPDNLVLVYIGMLILKVFHEFGHAMICKLYGGSVHTLGVMLLIFTPLPYMDATASWSFRSRWHRALVGAAGMLVELFFAALAALVWANTGDGMVHSLAFNMMIIGSVSSLMFNGNPLLRFDSYYILSDVLEIPNLYQRARDQWYYWVEHYLFGLDDVHSPGKDGKEVFWLGLYGIASFAYRILITIGILLFVSDQWFTLGVIVLLVGMYLWGIKPIYQFFIYLTTSNKLYRHRKRAMLASTMMIASLAVVIGVLPFPDSIRAQGIIQADPFVVAYADSDGVLQEVHYQSGQHVNAGDVIVTLKNPELAIKIISIQAHISEVQVLYDRALHERIADLSAIRARMAALKKKLLRLKKQQQALQFRASISGTWVDAGLVAREGTWFRRGEQLGNIISVDGVYFTAVVSQAEAAMLFDRKIPNQGVKLHGAATKTLNISDVRVIPYERNELPSAALGWLGGGDIAISTQAKNGKTSKESFFEIHANVNGQSESDFALLHGRTGILYIDLPSRPIIEQVSDFLSQLIQKRYQL